MRFIVQETHKSGAGRTDPGDDTTLRAGIRAARSGGGFPSVDRVKADLRGSTNELFASSNGNLSVRNMSDNKLVAKELVP